MEITAVGKKCERARGGRPYQIDNMRCSEMINRETKCFIDDPRYVVFQHPQQRFIIDRIPGFQILKDLGMYEEVEIEEKRKG